MVLKSPSESLAEMTELVLPNDTNLLGNLLGGRLLHWIDIVGAVAAQRHANKIVVTAAMDSVEFKQPVKVGEVVTLKAKVTWVGRTSMEVTVEVYSENFTSCERKFTNRAYITYVAVDKEGRPSEICGLLLETEEDKRENEAAQKRRDQRMYRGRSKG